jgi:hypothetical protein
MPSGNKGREQANEDALRVAADKAAAKSDEAITAAGKADPLEDRRRAQVLAFDKWQSGESGPMDVLNMPGGGTAIDLFKNAKRARDAGRIGRGYGLLGDNANPNFSASLDKEMQLERDVNASGALEQNVEDSIAGNNAELYGLAGAADSRNLSIAGLRSSADEGAQNRYTQYLLRPKQPSFLKQLALSAIGGASQIGAAYATAGGSGFGRFGKTGSMSAFGKA